MGANLQVRPTLVVEHTADNSLITFRFKNADVKMMAAEDDFEIGAKKFRAGEGGTLITEGSTSTIFPEYGCELDRSRCRQRRCESADDDGPSIASDDSKQDVPTGYFLLTPSFDDETVVSWTVTTT